MKRTVTGVIILLIMAVLCLPGCKKTEAPSTDTLWESATYKEDTSFGDGAKTLTVEVKAGEKAVTFTIRSDSETVGEALLAHGLIAGEEGQYGLYVKVVNGITADFDKDKSYWSFQKDGAMLQTGVDGTSFGDGEHFELVYVKE